MVQIRAQYHFRQDGPDLLAWDVRKLIALSTSFEPSPVPLACIAEFDQNHWFNHSVPTPRRIAEHAELIQAADLDYPIILDSAGRVMDGMHRLCKALLLGNQHIMAVQFAVDPEPHFKNVDPKDLLYD